MTGYGDLCRTISKIPVNQSLLKSEDIMHKLLWLLYRDFRLRKTEIFYPDIQSEPIRGVIRRKIRISKVVTDHLRSFYRLKWKNVEIKHFWCMFETPLIPYVFVGRDEADCNYTCISAKKRKKIGS